MAKNYSKDFYCVTMFFSLNFLLIKDSSENFK